MKSVRHVWIGATVPAEVPGGMRRHMMLHAAGLRDAGVRVTLAFEEDCRSTGVAPVDARIPGVRLLAGSMKTLRKDPPDIINVHSTAAPAFVAARAAGLLRSAVVAMSYAADERGLRFLGGQSTLRFLRAHVPARLTMPFADGIWCVSTEDAGYYVARYGVPLDAVTFIPHAIEESFFERSPVARDPLRLAFVGTWNRRKGADVLAAAMARVARARPDVTLTIAGTLGREEDVRRDMAGIAVERIRVLPRLDDAALRTLYHESALLLVPSRLEGMPFTMLEAMACGCPSLAAANSGMRDAIVDGQNGWLESSFDSAAWADRILHLVAAPDRLREASEAARLRAEEYRVGPLTARALDWYGGRLNRAPEDAPR